MAAGTASGDACVVHFSTSEAGGRAMTGLTSRSSRYMVSRFTFGGCTVMAAGAARGDACVIHFATFKAGGRAVTGLAGGGSGDVIG